MKLLVIVSNKIKHLERLLTFFGVNKIPSATILDSRGMAQMMDALDDLDFMFTIRLLINPTHKENKTIFMKVPGDMVSKISGILNVVTGGLGKPDIGILFTILIDYLEGLRKQ